MQVRSPLNQNGFSLIEVVVATTILLVGFIGVIQALTSGTEYLDLARKLQVANQIATAEIEKLRGGPWSTVANLPATASISLGPSGAISGDLTAFALSNRTVTPTDDNTALSALAVGFTCSFTRDYLRPTSATAATVTYIRVVYTVRWTSNTGHAKSHEVTGYFGKNGLHLSFQQS